jgi:hypothetical protein
MAPPPGSTATPDSSIAAELGCARAIGGDFARRRVALAASRGNGETAPALLPPEIHGL